MTKFTLSDAVINWYEKNHRKLPWRPKIGEKVNPYHTLLSEFMLQQTTVKTVIPYFNKFVIKYPNVFEFAKADLNEILTDWSGLGYYRRARNLHKTCKIICEDYNGNIPKNLKLLKSFPGIGDYTASAILAIGFNINSNVIDGNIERVICRVGRISKPINEVKKEVKLYSLKYLPNSKISYYVQGLMDIGATICRPSKTYCHLCPVEIFCKVSNSNAAFNLPNRKEKIKKPVRKAKLLSLVKNRESILLVKNADNGLFANMYVLPSSGLDGTENDIMNGFNEIERKKTTFKLNYSFTNFDLKASIFLIEIEKKDLKKLKLSSNFTKFKNLNSKPLPTLIKKVIRLVTDYYKINV